MRVLMTSWAWASHYMPLVPLGWALRAAGHEVRVASQPRLESVITDSGAVAVPVGPDLDHNEVRRRCMRDLRLTSVPEAPTPGASMDAWQPDAKGKVRQVFSVFAAYADAMTDDLLAYAKWWRPDLIVFDPTTYAGPLVAAALGIPAVRHVHGVDVTHQAREVVPELIEPLTRKLGLDQVELLGDLTVDPCPPTMQIPVGVKRRSVRYVPYNGPAVLPSWLWQRPERPRVCITWGTSTTRLAGNHAFLPPRVVEMIGDRGWDIVVSLIGHDVASLVEMFRGGDDIRVVESLPLHLLLPTCDAVIHQGGNGTMLSAIHDGVPQLVLPQLPDQMFHADRLAETGAGVVLRPDQVTESTVLPSVEALVADGSFREATGRMRDELHAQPTPAQIVPDLEALAR